jgi:MFS family permease
LGYLWVLGFAAAISRFVVAYYQQQITSDLEVTRSFISFTWSLNIAVAALCAPVGGWLTDKYGPKIIMVLNAVFGVVSMLTILVFQNAAGFFAGLGILAGLAGIGASTGYVLINRWFTQHRAKALMLMSSANALGLAVLTPVFVGYGDALDWLTAFTVTMWIGVISIPLTLLIVKDHAPVDAAEEPPASAGEPPPVEGGFSLLAAILKNPVTIVVSFALFTCGFSMGTVEMHLMAIHQHAQVGPAVFTVSLSLLGLLELAGGLLFAFLLDRMSRTLALSFLYAIRVAAFILLFLHLDLSPILFSVIFGASYLGAIPGGLLVASEALGSRSVGLLTGTLLVFHQAGAVIGAAIGGVLYDYTNSYQWLIGCNILFSAVSAAGYFWCAHKFARAQ